MTIHRNADGFSLIEMLTGMFIISFVAAAVAEIATIQNTVSFRTYNKLDTYVTARRSASDLERNIHMARFIGDQFSLPPPNPTPRVGPNFFPGAGTGDQYTLAGCIDPQITGFQGYPTVTSNSLWPAPPYQLGPQTLILQIPVFTLAPPDACPTPCKFTNSLGFWNVDTYVYQVIADSSKPGTGQFLLQKAIFPGERLPNYQPNPAIASNLPETVMTGIVGPIDPNTAPDPIAGTPPPKVFSYFTKQYPIYAATQQNIAQSIIQSNPPISSTDPPNLVGVGLNFELFSNSASSRPDYIGRTMAYHSEAYIRGNASSAY